MEYKKIKSLPPVSEMMRIAGLEPKKSLGQNFLFDLNLTRKIARAVPDIEKSTVLEIGPGPGGLTRALLESGAKKVIAVEKDKSAMPILEQIESAAHGRLEIIHTDAMGFQLPTLNQLAICSNLPYNIGTELLTNWLHHPDKIKSMTLMFQREVAERIVAKNGNKQYGRLSVLASLCWRAKILFNVPNTAFTPSPKVQSAVVQLIPTGEKYPIEKIERLTKILFGQRRKMIRGIMPNVDWTAFGLMGTERAENLSPETYAAIVENQLVLPMK